MWKNIAAGVAGIIVSVALVWLVETIGHSVYPPPEGLNYADADAMRAYLEIMPVGALLMVGLAWFIGTFGGTVTACRIGDASAMTFAIAVGGVMLFATVANLFMIPHPLWFAFLGVGAVIAGAWLGMTISGGSTAQTE